MHLTYTETVCSVNSIYTELDIPPLWESADNTAVEYTDNIVRLRKGRGWNQDQLAEKLGVAQPTVQRWESGKREPGYVHLKQMADLFGITVADIFTVNGLVKLGPALKIRGEVAAGQWKEAVEWPEVEWIEFTGRPDVTADIQHRFGLQVVGDSMNEIYPDGTIVECVSIFGRAEIKPGKRVVVIRQREDLQYEASVKEFVEIDGVPWARPRSFNPAHQAFRLDEPEDGILETRIAAVVVSSIRPE